MTCPVFCASARKECYADGNSATKCTPSVASQCCIMRWWPGKSPTSNQSLINCVLRERTAMTTFSLTTPLMRKHLNPFGRYYFDLNRMRRLQGEIP
jgi:hypothetical protein